MIIEDKPLSILTQDEFGREPLATLVAESIGEVCESSHGCMVYGIYGKWGEGKTTLMNFIENELQKNGKKNNIYISHFNPWLLNNEESLLKEFFSTIYYNCDEKLKRVIRKYGNMVSFASKTILNAVIPGVGIAFASIVDSAKKAFEGLDDTIAEQKQKVSDAIKSSGKHCVVLIDDIDRLDKDELHMVFRLIRQVADFTNTIYVVAMDVDIVSKSIGQFYGNGHEVDGRRFIDKIVQVPIVLPTIPDKLLHHSLSKELELLLVRYDVDKNRIIKLLDTICPMFKTRRDIIRYVNQLSFSLPAIYKDVNIEDLCALEAIKVRNPLAYHQVLENRSALLRQSTSLITLIDRDKASKELKNNYDNACVTICECFDKNEVQIVKTVLDYLFGHADYEYQRLIDEKHIQTDFFFPLYFIQSIPDEIIPFSEIEELKTNLMSCSQDSLVAWINKFFERYGEDEVIRAVLGIIRTGDIHQMSVRSSMFIKALAHSDMAKGYGYDFINNPTKVASIISTVIIYQYMYIPSSSPGVESVRDLKGIADTLNVMLSTADFNFCMAVVANDKSPLGLLEQEDESRCVDILTDRFERLEHGTQLKYSKYELCNLFSHWARCNRTSFDSYVITLIEDESMDYLNVLSHFIDGVHDSTDVNNFVLFFEAAISLLNKRILEDSRPEADTKERKLYLSNYKTILQNYGRNVSD